MNVKDLKAGQGKVDIQLMVKSVSDIRSFNKYGKELRVANAVGVDESGAEIKISLWNDDIKKVNAGDTIQITNGYVSEFNGERQLSAGKFGKIETVSADSETTQSTTSAPAPAKETKAAKPATASKASPASTSKKPVKKEALDEEKEKALEADEEKEEDFNYEEKEF